jgi:nucleoside-diphosphate-sugar epimerase
MPILKVLFLGGTGAISQACTALAVQRGISLTLVNRGIRDVEVPGGVRIIKADIRDRDGFARAVTDEEFDVVVNWIAYTPDHVETDIGIFKGRIGQYVFISSASAYQKPPGHYLITESTPLANPYWQYSRDKIACEERLMREYRENGFPVTIVRPSYTYNSTVVPTTLLGWDYTVLDRMRKGRAIVVHGDGSSLWTMTHNTDFALGFNGLLGNPQATGQAFHITSDEVLTWNQIFETIGAAAGVKPKLVHVPSDFIAGIDPDRGASLLGDKTWSAVFDNSKIKRFVPDFVATKTFAQGMRESVSWFDGDPARRKVSDKANEITERILAAFKGQR